MPAEDPSRLEALQKIREILNDTEALANRVGSSLVEVEERAGSVESRVSSIGEGTAGLVGSIGSQVGEIEEHLSRAEGAVVSVQERISSGLEKARSQAEARLGELIATLEASTAPISEGILASIEAVEQGIADASQIATKFGDTLVPFEGRMQRLRDVLQEVLPTTGEVQNRLKEMSDEMRTQTNGIDQALAKLIESTFEYSQSFGSLVERFRKGKATLESVIRAAQDLKRQFPGSEAAELSDVLADAARAGEI